MARAYISGGWHGEWAKAEGRMALGTYGVTGRRGCHGQRERPRTQVRGLSIGSRERRGLVAGLAAAGGHEGHAGTEDCNADEGKEPVE